MALTGYVIPEFDAGRLAIGYRDGERWGTLLDKQDLDRGFLLAPEWEPVASTRPRIDMNRWLRSLRTQEILTDDSTAKLFGRHVSGR